MSFQRCGNYFWQKINRNENPKTPKPQNQKKKEKIEFKKIQTNYVFF